MLDAEISRERRFVAMAFPNNKAPFDSEKLIEEIRKCPVLYDPSSDKYKNIEYKEMVWRKIAAAVQAKGGVDQCKRKWSSFRDQLRRTLHRRKTSGRLVRKYKYEDILGFLRPHLIDTCLPEKTFDYFPEDDESIFATTQDDTQQLDLDEMITIKEESTTEDCFQSPTTSWESSFVPSSKLNDVSKNATHLGAKYSDGASESRGSPRSRSRSPVRSRRTSSPASQLMAYILAEKEDEKKNKQAEQHSVDAFLSGISATLKTLSPILLNEAKGKIFSMVQELELKHIISQQSNSTPSSSNA